MGIVYAEIKKKSKYIALTFVIKCFATIVELLIPLLLSYIIDDVIERENIWEIIFFGFLMLVATFFAFMSNVIANRMSSRSSTQITKEVRKQLYYKVSYLSEKQVDDVTIPTLVSRLTTDTYNVHQVIGMIQRAGVRGPIMLVGGIFVTLVISPMLTIILLVTLPFIAAISIIASKKGFPMYRVVQKKIDKQVEVVRENITGIRVVKALSKTEYEKNRFDNANQDTVYTEKKAAIIMSTVNPIVSLVLNTGLVGVLLFGGYLIDKGTLEPGSILGFMLIFNYILNSMLMITRIFMMISRASASIGRIHEIMDLEEDLKIQNPTYFGTDDYIVFDNVDFSYNGVKNDLTNINIRLKKGESLGILGATGSGKTTLINLLLRLYDPTRGGIYLEGKNINSYDEKTFRKNFGVVFQNDIVFGDTIENNIDFYRNLSKEEINNAVKNSEAKFINEPEVGLNHEVASRGLNLSGGQKQRLLIARSMAAKPNILILDDASSALDYKTDANLRKNINENFKDTTLIIVAQRISSIMNCSKIIILDEGRIVDMGTHEELLKTSKIYQTISELQMGAFNE